MMLRVMLSALATSVAVSAQALTFDGAPSEMPAIETAARVTGLDQPSPAAAAERGEIILAQAGDPRITALEEQVRQLSGTIEELNFQILQMQDQLRRMQEDNEFRFQQLEGGGSGDRSDAGGRAAPAEPQTGVANAEVVPQPLPDGGTRTFGTITFDENGNPTGGSVGEAGQPEVLVETAPSTNGADGTTVAALPSTDDPEELYRTSYELIMAGDYRTAETGFRDLIDRFPDSPRMADAHFWLGEAILGQNRFRDAAEVFLAASRDYSESRKAPDMLLKLGISLSAMDQRDVACATFTEIGMRFPDSSDAMKQRVREEEARAGC